MLKIIGLFIAMIVLTAIFSYSLNVFMQANFTVLTLKTMLIPCFTWTGLFVAAFLSFKGERRLQYFTIAGWVGAIGSLVLVPAGIYNFLVSNPLLWISVASILICAVTMSILFYLSLKKAAFSLNWWMAYNVLICINMTLFYVAATQ